MTPAGKAYSSSQVWSAGRFRGNVAAGIGGGILNGMAKKRPLTRAERRARPKPPDARVYAVIVKDAGASGWESEVAFWASTPDEAKQRLHAAEFYSRVIVDHLEHDDLDAEIVEAASREPGEMFLRQFNDDGPTEWLRLPAGYRHPPQGAAALDPSLRLTGPRPGVDPDGRWQYRDPNSPGRPFGDRDS